MAARAVSDCGRTLSVHCLDSHLDFEGSNFRSSSTEEPWIENEQQVTIFHQGRACSFDLVELQARAIIILASRASNRAGNPEAAATSLEKNQLHLQCQISSEVSVKRFLQKFLQQRKRRIGAISPYNLNL